MIIPQNQNLSKEALESVAKTDKDIPLQNENLSKQALEKAKEKFKSFSDEKIKTLLDWHKTSNPLTKDKDGLPLVFYHGSKIKNLDTFNSKFDSSNWGFWFSKDKAFIEDTYAETKENLTEAFLRLDNPLDARNSFNAKDLKSLKNIFDLKDETLQTYKYLTKCLKNLKNDLRKNGFEFVSMGGKTLEVKIIPSKYKDLLDDLYEEWAMMSDKERQGYDKNKEGLKKALDENIALFKSDDTLNYILKRYDIDRTEEFSTYNKTPFLTWFDNLMNKAPQSLRDALHIDSELGLLLAIENKQQYTKTNTRELLKNNGYDGIILNDNVAVAFNSNQIKAVGNKGTFNPQIDNIYHSNAHLGSGLVGGTLAGVDKDEDGNLSFNPAKFAAGFLGGAGASKAVSFASKKAGILERIRLKNDIIPRLNKGEKVDSDDIIKILEKSPQKGQGMQVIGQNNFSDDIVKWAIENNKKVAVDILSKERANALGFRYDKVKRTISGAEINHALKRHGGENEVMPLKLEHIKKWIEYADNADIQALSKDNQGQEVLISGKQINGYYVIVESVRKKNNELAFKTMYFQNGSLEKSNAFKNASIKSK